MLAAKRLLQMTALGSSAAMLKEARQGLDRHCLDLCIVLLDHDLKGELFESVVVGFLAVLGIEVGKSVLKEAYGYTSILSGFMKIAQMLVLQKAVAATSEGHVAHPADLLDEMRERFLVHGTRSPFNWAGRLRMYGKKIRDTTTALGYISWTEDEQCASYKDVSCLNMDDFRRFVKCQVTAAQNELEELLLVHPQENRHDLGIGFWMHRLVDNAAEKRRDWSFIRHPQNLEGALPNRGNWLLERVLQNDWLREEFLVARRHDPGDDPRWNFGAVYTYKAKVDNFLERLALLVHVTSGQPARGTETLALRHINTLRGHHRNVFVENGHISTVLSYQKGYSVTSSTKIIHRFLPKEVGELLVYYLWLVLPFCRKMDLLALGKRAQPSPFIWATPKGSEWDSGRLSRVMKREFKAILGVPMTIPIYRHLAIAISRKHLPDKGFKRDYGLENTVFDQQAAHGSWTAGSIYARGMEEAAGHVEERKSEYLAMSKKWHIFLGFLPTSLPPRKRLFCDITNIGLNPSKRARM